MVVRAGGRKFLAELSEMTLSDWSTMVTGVVFGVVDEFFRLN